MEQSKAKRVIFMSILFVMFFLLSAFLVTRIYGIYIKEYSFVNNTAGPAVDCIKYVYDASAASYESGVLSFMLANPPYSPEIEQLVVEGNEKKTLRPRLLPGEKVRIEVQIKLLNDTFYIYPKQCEVYKKEVKLK